MDVDGADGGGAGAGGAAAADAGSASKPAALVVDTSSAALSPPPQQPQPPPPPAGGGAQLMASNMHHFVDTLLGDGLGKATLWHLSLLLAAPPAVQAALATATGSKAPGSTGTDALVRLLKLAVRAGVLEAAGASGEGPSAAVAAAGVQAALRDVSHAADAAAAQDAAAAAASAADADGVAPAAAAGPSSASTAAAAAIYAATDGVAAADAAAVLAWVVVRCLTTLPLTPALAAALQGLLVPDEGAGDNAGPLPADSSLRELVRQWTAAQLAAAGERVRDAAALGRAAPYARALLANRFAAPLGLPIARGVGGRNLRRAALTALAAESAAGAAAAAGSGAGADAASSAGPSPRSVTSRSNGKGGKGAGASSAAAADKALARERWKRFTGHVARADADVVLAAVRLRQARLRAASAPATISAEGAPSFDSSSATNVDVPAPPSPSNASVASGGASAANTSGGHGGHGGGGVSSATATEAVHYGGWLESLRKGRDAWEQARGDGIDDYGSATLADWAGVPASPLPDPGLGDDASVSAAAGTAAGGDAPSSSSAASVAAAVEPPPAPLAVDDAASLPSRASSGAPYYHRAGSCTPTVPVDSSPEATAPVLSPGGPGAASGGAPTPSGAGPTADAFSTFAASSTAAAAADDSSGSSAAATSLDATAVAATAAGGGLVGALGALVRVAGGSWLSPGCGDSDAAVAHPPDWALLAPLLSYDAAALPPALAAYTPPAAALPGLLPYQAGLLRRFHGELRRVAAAEGALPPAAAGGDADVAMAGAADSGAASSSSALQAVAPTFAQLEADRLRAAAAAASAATPPGGDGTGVGAGASSTASPHFADNSETDDIAALCAHAAWLAAQLDDPDAPLGLLVSLASRTGTGPHGPAAVALRLRQAGALDGGALPLPGPLVPAAAAAAAAGAGSSDAAAAAAAAPLRLRLPVDRLQDLVADEAAVAAVEASAAAAKKAAAAAAASEKVAAAAAATAAAATAQSSSSSEAGAPRSIEDAANEEFRQSQERLFEAIKAANAARVAAAAAKAAAAAEAAAARGSKKRKKPSSSGAGDGSGVSSDGGEPATPSADDGVAPDGDGGAGASSGGGAPAPAPAKGAVHANTKRRFKNECELESGRWKATVRVRDRNVTKSSFPTAADAAREADAIAIRHLGYAGAAARGFNFPEEHPHPPPSQAADYAVGDGAAASAAATDAPAPPTGDGGASTAASSSAATADDAGDDAVVEGAGGRRIRFVSQEPDGTWKARITVGGRPFSNKHHATPESAGRAADALLVTHLGLRGAHARGLNFPEERPLKPSGGAATATTAARKPATSSAADAGDGAASDSDGSDSSSDSGSSSGDESDGGERRRAGKAAAAAADTAAAVGPARKFYRINKTKQGAYLVKVHDSSIGKQVTFGTCKTAAEAALRADVALFFVHKRAGRATIDTSRLNFPEREAESRAAADAMLAAMRAGGGGGSGGGTKASAESPTGDDSDSGSSGEADGAGSDNARRLATASTTSGGGGGAGGSGGVDDVEHVPQRWGGMGKKGKAAADGSGAKSQLQREVGGRRGSVSSDDAGDVDGGHSAKRARRTSVDGGSDVEVVEVSDDEEVVEEGVADDDADGDAADDEEDEEARRARRAQRKAEKRARKEAKRARREDKRRRKEEKRAAKRAAAAAGEGDTGDGAAAAGGALLAAPTVSYLPEPDPSDELLALLIGCSGSKEHLHTNAERKRQALETRRAVAAGRGDGSDTPIGLPHDLGGGSSSSSSHEPLDADAVHGDHYVNAPAHGAGGSRLEEVYSQLRQARSAYEHEAARLAAVTTGGKALAGAGSSSSSAAPVAGAGAGAGSSSSSSFAATPPTAPPSATAAATTTTRRRVRWAPGVVDTGRGDDVRAPVGARELTADLSDDDKRAFHREQCEAFRAAWQRNPALTGPNDFSDLAAAANEEPGGRVQALRRRVHPLFVGQPYPLLYYPWVFPDPTPPPGPGLPMGGVDAADLQWHRGYKPPSSAEAALFASSKALFDVFAGEAAAWRAYGAASAEATRTAAALAAAARAREMERLGVPPGRHLPQPLHPPQPPPGVPQAVPVPADHELWRSLVMGRAPRTSPLRPIDPQTGEPLPLPPPPHALPAELASGAASAAATLRAVESDRRRVRAERTLARRAAASAAAAAAAASLAAAGGIATGAASGGAPAAGGGSSSRASSSSAAVAPTATGAGAAGTATGAAPLPSYAQLRAELTAAEEAAARDALRARLGPAYTPTHPRPVGGGGGGGSAFGRSAGVGRHPPGGDAPPSYSVRVVGPAPSPPAPPPAVGGLDWAMALQRAVTAAPLPEQQRWGHRTTTHESQGRTYGVAGEPLPPPPPSQRAPPQQQPPLSRPQYEQQRYGGVGGATSPTESSGSGSHAPTPYGGGSTGRLSALPSGQSPFGAFPLQQQQQQGHGHCGGIGGDAAATSPYGGGATPLPGNGGGGFSWQPLLPSPPPVAPMSAAPTSSTTASSMATGPIQSLADIQRLLGSGGPAASPALPVASPEYDFPFNISGTGGGTGAPAEEEEEEAPPPPPPPLVTGIRIAAYDAPLQRGGSIATPLPSPTPSVAADAGATATVGGGGGAAPAWTMHDPFASVAPPPVPLLGQSAAPASTAAAAAATSTTAPASSPSVDSDRMSIDDADEGGGNLATAASSSSAAAAPAHAAVAGPSGFAVAALPAFAGHLASRAPLSDVDFTGASRVAARLFRRPPQETAEAAAMTARLRAVRTPFACPPEVSDADAAADPALAAATSAPPPWVSPQQAAPAPPGAAPPTVSVDPWRLRNLGTVLVPSAPVATAVDGAPPPKPGDFSTAPLGAGWEPRYLGQWKQWHGVVYPAYGQDGGDPVVGITGLPPPDDEDDDEEEEGGAGGGTGGGQAQQPPPPPPSSAASGSGNSSGSGGGGAAGGASAGSSSGGSERPRAPLPPQAQLLDGQDDGAARGRQRSTSRDRWRRGEDAGAPRADGGVRRSRSRSRSGVRGLLERTRLSSSRDHGRRGSGDRGALAASGRRPGSAGGSGSSSSLSSPSSAYAHELLDVRTGEAWSPVGPGNTMPCRFWHRADCERGAHCPYVHANRYAARNEGWERNGGGGGRGGRGRR